MGLTQRLRAQGLVASKSSRAVSRPIARRPSRTIPGSATPRRTPVKSTLRALVAQAIDALRANGIREPIAGFGRLLEKH